MALIAFAIRALAVSDRQMESPFAGLLSGVSPFAEIERALK